MDGLHDGRINRAIDGYRSFLRVCRADVTDFRLTPLAEPTVFARCFAVYGLWLIGEHRELDAARDALAVALRRDVRGARAAAGAEIRSKAFRQLLCFSLSALAVLGVLEEDPLPDLVLEQLPDDLEQELRELGSLEGRAQSGNQAMFLAVFLIHAQRYLGHKSGAALEAWMRLHRSAMNRHGFWGPQSGPTHLHFQNGYHQYEILEYLQADNPGRSSAIEAVRQLADAEGHFAPHPGGGGCFDYDAVHVLTPEGRMPDEKTVAMLRTTAATIIAEQQADGGFCESLRVRPRLRSGPGYAERLASARNFALFKERLRYALTLQRPKHDRIHTHWSRYQRRWDESNLWDSWFRMLTLARIECAFDPARAAEWGFIDYPGIGWHPSLRRPSDR